MSLDSLKLEAIEKLFFWFWFFQIILELDRVLCNLFNNVVGDLKFKSSFDFILENVCVVLVDRGNSKSSFDFILENVCVVLIDRGRWQTKTFFHDCKISCRHMPSGRRSLMDLEPAYKMESIRAVQDIQHEFWPLDEINRENAKFPCCLVWTPLPVVSWLAPFIGHVGICREDGSAVAFSGSNFINIDDFALGSVAKYLQLDRKQCCFPRNLAAHTCKHGYKHTEFGSAITWDDAIQSSIRHFEHKSYNIFTCNSYSFLANCLNRLCYGGSMDWNMINVGALLLFKGHWVDNMSILRSFSPFMLVVCFGIFMVGWPFMVALLAFSLLLLAWFIFGTYCLKNLLDS